MNEQKKFTTEGREAEESGPDGTKRPRSGSQSGKKRDWPLFKMPRRHPTLRCEGCGTARKIVEREEKIYKNMNRR